MWCDDSILDKRRWTRYRIRDTGPYLSDPLSFGIYAIIILVLALISGLFAALDSAIGRLSLVRHKVSSQETDRQEALTILAADKAKYRTTCQLGIFLPVIGLGWLSEAAISSRLAPVLENMGLDIWPAAVLSTTLAIVVITLTYLGAGRWIPSVLSSHFQEHLLRKSGRFLILFTFFMSPLIWFLNIGVRGPAHRESTHLSVKREKVQSEEEWLQLMKDSKNDGIIDAFEYTLLDNIFDFSATTAREIMIPRTEMICLNTEWTIQENLTIASMQMRTRYPVCTGDKDQIIGFVHLKDLFMSGMEEYLTTIRPILSVPESTSIAILLKQMKMERTQIAIVIDEYGGTSGLVTLEDIVEEILGEIQDEFDNERPLVEYIGASEYSIDGLILLEELNQLLSLDIEESGYDTLGGWVLSMLNSFPPKPGDCISYGDYQYRIEEVDHHRISRIEVKKKTVSNHKEAGA